MPHSLSKILLYLGLGVFLLTSAFTQKNTNEKHIEVSMRMIGHQILLQSNDSTSRVLPIVKENSQYTISFAEEFQFEPDKLAASIDSVLQSTKITEHYLVELINCETAETIYSYEVGNTTNTNIIPCRGRIQPKACYQIAIHLLDSHTPLLNSDENLQETIPITTKLSSTIKPLYILIFLFIISFLGGFWFLKRMKKNTTKHLIAVGAYSFDTKNMTLSIGKEKTELTAKESDLLLLLHNNANNTVEKTTILKEIWNDEGAYVGRTLDVFISKLRKKLEADAQLKIINIRGIGYKLLIER